LVLSVTSALETSSQLYVAIALFQEMEGKGSQYPLCGPSFSWSVVKVMYKVKCPV
jgi:hypothetical protein